MQQTNLSKLVSQFLAICLDEAEEDTTTITSLHTTASKSLFRRSTKLSCSRPNHYIMRLIMARILFLFYLLLYFFSYSQARLTVLPPPAKLIESFRSDYEYEIESDEYDFRISNQSCFQSPPSSLLLFSRDEGFKNNIVVLCDDLEYAL